MKKIWTAAVALGCTAVMAVSFSACDFSAFGSKSAYEIAVENGFTGTEADWVKSLQGADGSDGADLDIEEVYAAAVENGYEGSFLEFLKEYLSADVSENNDTDAIAHNMMSVVSVYSGFRETKKTASWPFGGTVTTTSLVWAAGSGVIYDLNKEAGNAYVITNFHVIYDAESDNGIADYIYLSLYGGITNINTSTGENTDGLAIPATYVGGAADYDIAVLKVQGSEILRESSAEEAEIGSSEEITTGEKVFAIGNPEGDGISVTEGVISVDSEYIQLESTINLGTAVSMRVMRTDAAINPGNSGGGLFDAQGKLVGITNAKLGDSFVYGETSQVEGIHSVDNMGYALPITQVMYVVDNIMDNGGSVKRATLGVTVQTVESKSILENGKAVIVETVSVADITKGSAGDGIFETGDILKSIIVGNTKTEIRRRYQVIDLLLCVRKGDTVKVTVERDGKATGLSITFDKDEYFTAVS